MSTTPQMGLVLPVPSASTPDWGALLNTAFNLIDVHDHTAGHGIQVPSAGIGINADLPFNGFNLTQARTLRLQQQAAAPALAADAGCIYATTAGDLWFNNGAGQHVQITSGSALSAASLGGISGLGGTSAGVAFNNATKTFTFTQASNQGAILDAGPLVIHDTAASAFGITLQSPVGIAGAYALTLPTALPAANALLSISSGGALTAFGKVTGSSLELVDKLTLANGTTGIQVTLTGGFLLLQGNVAAADASNADVQFSSTATRTAGYIASVQNPLGTSKLLVDYQGLLQLASQAAPIQPASVWTAVTPNTGWVYSGGSIPAPSFWKDATGTVHCRGQVTNVTGTSGSAFTFPVGFRPAASRFFACVGVSNALVVGSVASTGAVTFNAVTTGLYTLDAITFLAEA